MEEEQKYVIIEQGLGSEVMEFLKSARMHPHIKTRVLSLMVDYATVKNNTEFMLEKTELKGVTAYHSKEEIEEAFYLMENGSED